MVQLNDRNIKSNGRSEYYYIGLANFFFDFFRQGTENLFTLNSDFSRFYL